MLRKTALVILTALLFVSCVPAAPFTPAGTTAPTALPTANSIAAIDAKGGTLTLAQPAQRVVSLAPSNTEILFAVGAGAQVVGRDSFSDYPSEATRITDLGSGYPSLNVEAILATKPDLVLATPLTPVEQIAALKSAGLTVFIVPNPKDFQGLFANLRTVGDLTGHTADALAAVVALNNRVEAVAQAVRLSGAEKPLVYYELDATDPAAPYTSGPGTFIDLLIRAAGGVNFGATLSGEWAQVSVEDLLDRQPDFIVLGDSAYGVTAQTVAARTGWSALKAVQANHVLPFDDNLLSRPGPRMVDGLEAMAKLLHPDLPQ